MFNGSNVTIITNKENNVWFNKKDVTEILKYQNLKDALQKQVSFYFRLQI